jgi:hypothetical protein
LPVYTLTGFSPAVFTAITGGLFRVGNQVQLGPGRNVQTDSCSFKISGASGAREDNLSADPMPVARRIAGIAHSPEPETHDLDPDHGRGLFLAQALISELLRWIAFPWGAIGPQTAQPNEMGGA